MQQRSKSVEAQNIARLQVVRNKNKSYRHFGVLLGAARRDAGVTRSDIETAYREWSKKEELACLGILLPNERRIQPLTAKTYGKLERNEQPPKFDQLLVLYIAMTAGCGVDFAGEEDDFIELARSRIESKAYQYRENLSDQNWDWLKKMILLADGRQSSYTFSPEQNMPRSTQEKLGYSVAHEVDHVDTQARNRPVEEVLYEEIESAIKFDTSHIIGRDTFMNTQISYLEETPRKKIVVFQAMTGVGKSTVLKLLTKRLEEKSGYTVLPVYRLKPAQDKTPQDYLDSILAKLIQDICPQNEMAQSQSLEKRIQYILLALQEQQCPTIILLDDLHLALEADGALSAGWQQWFAAFMEKDHRASLFVATREWPRWQERERNYIEETNLEDLPPTMGAEIWKRLGFNDVADDLLQQASCKCGGNPNLIELRAASLKRQHQRYSFDWDDDRHFSEQQQVIVQNNAQRIRDFLADPRVVDENDLEAQQLLKQVIGRHLSDDGLHLLEVLSLATIPLAFPLLKVISDNVQYAFVELQKASFIDYHTPRRIQLLPLVREAGFQRVLEGERTQEIERVLIEMYQQWISVGTFGNEKGDVVAELAVLLLKHQCLLQAAELLIRFGWLAFNAGHTTRLARLAEQTMHHMNWHAIPENECGGILLLYFLSPFLGKKVSPEKRLNDYQHIHHIIFSGKVALQPSSEIHITHHLMLIAMNASRFLEAQALLEACCTRLEHAQQSNRDLEASLLEKRAWLFGRWCDDTEQPKDGQITGLYREQAISFYRQCSNLLAEDVSHLNNSELFKRQQRLARVLNYLGYHLGRLGKHEEALKALERSLELQEQGYTEVDGLAPIYGDMSQTFMALGQFQKALEFDVKAYAEAQRLYDAGYTFSKEEIWIYHVNRGRLYLRLGRIEEAEKLLREASSHIHPRRKMYQMFVKEAIEEIEEIKHVSTRYSHYQLDWRWVDRYRQLASFDSYWWLTPTGPFNTEEQKQWNQLITQKLDEATKEQLEMLLLQSRERELVNALAEKREPHLCYPAIDFADVSNRIHDLIRLQAEISEHEPNAIIRYLYGETIDEEICFLRLIEATYKKDSESFWNYNTLMNPVPTIEEMNYAFSRVMYFVSQGLQREDTKQISQQIIQYIREQLRLSIYSTYSDQEALAQQEIGPLSSPHEVRRMVSSKTAKLFFEDILQKYDYRGWKVVIDPRAAGPYIEQGLRHVYLPDRELSVHQIRGYLAHELGVHAARCVAGERSLIGLLGIHTKNSLETEEGLATYEEIHLARRAGQSHDETAIWFGTLATGIASGVITPPQTFSSVFTFFEQFILLYRLLRRPDQDALMAQKQAKRLALARCIRTFRGVPDLNRTGICYSKDALYLRGLWRIEQAVKRDKTVLDRLSVGVIAHEQLPYLREMEIVTSPQSLRELLDDPNLDSYILSFESQVSDSKAFTELERKH